MERQEEPATEGPGAGDAAEGEQRPDEGSRGHAIEPEDALPDEDGPPQPSGSTGPDIDHVVEEKRRRD